MGEDGHDRPKPMVEIGGRPILWHIMKHLSHYGLNDFVIALGYRGDTVKRYFMDMANAAGDMEVDMSTGLVAIKHEPPPEGWRVHLIDTGILSNTAWRLQQIRRLLTERFMVTYGDGLTDLDVRALLDEHAWSRSRREAICTLTAVHPMARYGSLVLGEEDRVAAFHEKSDESWVNGGYMVFEPEIFEVPAMREATPDTDLAHGILEPLAKAGGLFAYQHKGFWQCMDTPRERQALEDVWNSRRPPWKVW